MSARIKHGQDFGTFSITVQMSAENALLFFFGWLQYDGSCPIAEYHRNISASCAKVYPKRMFFATNNKYVLVHAGLNKLITNADCIQKTAALITNIKCANLFHLHRPLKEYTTSGKIIVRAKRGKNDEINILRSNTCPLYCNFAGFNRHCCCCFPCA